MLEDLQMFGNVCSLSKRGRGCESRKNDIGRGDDTPIHTM